MLGHFLCRRAGANVAAVNYYFGDKESLYVAAWRQAMEQFVYADTIPPQDLPPEERMRLTIYRIIRKILSIGHDSGTFRRIELMELANPTGLIDDTWKQLIAPRRREMLELIRDLMGPKVPEDSVRLCEMSIVNQCRGYILLQKSRLTFFDDEALTVERVDRIAEHITRFSIGGIKAIRRRIENDV
jgi:TetR/AcrR family transcriptional regulator, regulator of cefoperazone and chloramphenicol sensitivity